MAMPLTRHYVRYYPSFGEVIVVVEGLYYRTFTEEEFISINLDWVCINFSKDVATEILHTQMELKQILNARGLSPEEPKNTSNVASLLEFLT